MAERRMFTKKITDSDAFIELPSSTQALYFHLNQGADDDGFNNQIQNAMFKSHSTIDDLKVLMLKNFIIRFESGVIVIKHWRMHNTLRKDRYTPTNFQDEFQFLGIEENGSYALSDNGCQVVAKRLPQDRLGKDRLDKDSIYNIPASEEKSSTASVKANGIVSLKDEELQTKKKEKEVKHKYGNYKNVLLTDSELNKLKAEYSNYEELITYLDEYIEMKGYKAKSHYLCIKKWVIDAVKRTKSSSSIPDWVKDM